jgi:uncharacterized repeat protein (TIGR01451 family)
MKNARLFVCLFVIAIVLQAPTIASATGLSVQPIDGTTVTADSLANMLAGAGVSVSNATYNPGSNNASGTFSGGADIIGIGSGVLLTSGDVGNVVGPNLSDSKGTSNGGAGDGDLDTLSGQTTHDASVLEFDFTTDQATVFFQYVFASDEYNEYVNTAYNDTFGFFVNGTNCATVGGDPITIDTINKNVHSGLYRNNDPSDGTPPIDTEMDGLTTVLTCEATVNVGPATNHIKLAIADATDFAFDSAVFLKAGSFSTTPTHTLSVAVSGGGSGNVESNPVGISCPGIEGPCSNQFDEGSNVSLTAIPDAGSDFTAWGGDCAGELTATCTLTMNTDKSATASFEPSASADLSILKSDTGVGYGPDPVSSGQVVAYNVSVTNGGPDAATGVTVTDTVTSGGTIVGAAGTGWTCPGPFPAGTTTTTCTRASLANGVTAPPITVQVKANTTSVASTINDTVTVSGNEADPDSEDNTDTESTTVSSSGTADHAAGFCNGATTCNISTDPGTGATKTDPTVSILTIPAAATADPQTITLSEFTSTTLCGGGACQGQVVEITSNPSLTFAGVTDPNHPAVLTMIFDKTVKQGSQVYIKEGTAAPKLVKNCTTPMIASPHPCVSEKNIVLPNGDREFKILFLEGDPIIGKR